MRDYYRRLGLPPFADLHEIRRAYRELARRIRAASDDRGAAARLGSLHRAYEVLSDQERRRVDGTGPVRGYRMTGRENAFADEVDVDFPSVSNLVGRMRSAFFGPPSARPLSAEVRLTPRQADAGVSVPLDVSLRHTCPVCGGRGEVWLDPCGACSGSGGGLLPHQFQVVVPPGVRDGAYLRFDVTRPYAPATLVQVRISVQ
jgi:DnaJ-class molecular chaperone